jgi:hypothetical protein
MKITLKVEGALLFLLMFCSSALYAQTGPGGVGNSSSNGLWLRADALNQVDGSTVSAWPDNSGNNNNAIQATAGKEPLFYNTSGVNNQPIIRFDGNNDEMSVLDANILDGTTGITYYAVIRPNNLNGGPRGILGKRVTYTVSTEYAYTWFMWANNRMNLDIHTQNNRFNTASNTFTNATNYLFSMSFNGTLPSAERSRIYSQGIKIQQSTESSTVLPNSNQDLAIGALNVGYGTYLGADFAEIIHFNYDLDTVEQVLVDNYLAAKYGISLSANDLYDEDNAANGNYDFEVAGIGRFDAARIHDDSQGSSILRILNPSDLDNNEFMIWGHDGGEQQAIETSDIPAGVDARFERVWRVSEVDMSSSPVEVGSVDIRWDLAGLGSVTASDLRLLIDTDNDGTFADETPIAGATSIGGDIYEFSAQAGLQNNLRFTLATINSNATPLPIELISFEGKAIDLYENELTWSTASESNNSHFIVEHSRDAQTWESIGQLEGQGNSLVKNDYSLSHLYPELGDNYYRLLQVDFDGTLNYSNVILIKNKKESIGFEIYPNPSNGIINLISDQKIKEIPRLFDCSGKSLNPIIRFSSNSDYSMQIDLSELAKGTYLLRFANKTKLVVKE